MLRLFAFALLMANAVYFGYTRGWLRPWGWAPVQQSEPQRIPQQVRPETLRIMPADEARRTQAAPVARSGPECLQAGPLDATQLAALRERTAGWPQGSWQIDTVALPARWIVYMGRYADREQVEKKKSELRWRKLSFEPLSDPSLEPGLSLGGYASQPEAVRELEALQQRGVRTARVLQERPALQAQMLRLPAVDDALRPQVEALRPALAGRPLQACG